MKLARLLATSILVTLSLWIFAGSAAAGINQWTTNGPYITNIQALALSPFYASDNKIFWANSSGIYVSTNGGMSWTNLSSLSISSLTLSPSYATDQTLFAANSCGLYKSTNGGRGWFLSNTGITSNNIRQIAISPYYATDQTLYVATYAGAFKSTNGGASWTAVNSGIANINVLVIAISPNYASDQTVFAGSYYGGLYKSTNGGESWTTVLTGDVRVLAVSPNYALDHTIFMGNWGGGMYRSTDEGNTWYPINTGINYKGIFAIAVSPSYAVDRMVFVNGYSNGTYNGLYRSTDGGNTWTALITGDSNSLAISPNFATDHTVYAGSLPGGSNAASLYKSSDGGTNWTAMNGISANVVSLSMSPGFVTDRTIFEVNNTTLYKSIDGGTSWTALNTAITNIDAIALSPNYTNDKTVYLGTGTTGGYIYKSTNGGLSWTTEYTNANSAIQALAVSPNFANDQTAFAGCSTSTWDLFRTTDGGSTWMDTLDGIVSIYSLALSPNYTNDRTLFTGTGYGVYKSTDGGLSRINANTGITNTNIQTVAMSPNYAIDQTVYAGGGGGVYLSTNGGASWTVVNTGITNTNIQAIVVSTNYATDQTVYAGGGGGVYRSTNGGASWTTINSGITTSVKDLAISPNYASDRTLYAGTNGGVWSYTDDTTPPVVSAGPNKTTNAQFVQTATATGVTPMTYSWSQEAGPGTITFGSSSVLSTTISANADGAYVIQFTATDPAGNAASSTASLTWDATPPVSAITSPLSGSIPAGSCTITGSASDGGGTGVRLVEVSTNGGITWNIASDTSGSSTWANWSYAWAVDSAGTNNILTRATDKLGNVETPGVGISLTASQVGTPELPHFNWDASVSQSPCTRCHVASSTFLSGSFMSDAGFCRSCHNNSGVAHDKDLIGSCGHSIMVNVTSGGGRLPTYGNITAGEYNNEPYSRLRGGNKVVCITCHNAMGKPEDFGRVWEYTTTSDNKTYTLQNSGWAAYGYLVPEVYRDTSLWSGPTYSKARKAYLVDPSEYTYNETAGTITFRAVQLPTTYVYVTLDYPYLRAGNGNNKLCSDCHTQVTHKGINCLICHQAHNTNNLADIKGVLRTSNRTTIAVKFMRYTGNNSFADGDTTYDGICEVCHTQTKYYRRDGSGFTNHSGGVNYDKTNCTACHDHSTGFSKYQ